MFKLIEDLVKLPIDAADDVIKTVTPNERNIIEEGSSVVRRIKKISNNE